MMYNIFFLFSCTVPAKIHWTRTDQPSGMLSACFGLEPGVPLGVKKVSLLVIVVTLLGVLVLPAVVGVDAITSVVSVGLSTVQV